MWEEMIGRSHYGLWHDHIKHFATNINPGGNAMKSYIDKLEEAVWFYCVRQRAAKDDATMRRWQEDEFYYLKESLVVMPLPAELNSLCKKALNQWAQIEKKVCAAAGMERKEFLERFQGARQDFLSGGKKWIALIAPIAPACHGVVKNLDWVNLFALYLPLADRQNLLRNAKTGRMVTAIFYTEFLSRYGFDQEDKNLKRIDATWRLNSSLIDISSF